MGNTISFLLKTSLLSKKNKNPYSAPCRLIQGEKEMKMTYQAEIIKSKADARAIIEALEERTKVLPSCEGMWQGIEYYHNGNGGTVSLWIDDDGNFWTATSGRREKTRKTKESSIQMLFDDRKYRNAAQRRQVKRSY